MFMSIELSGSGNWCVFPFEHLNSEIVSQVSVYALLIWEA